MTRVTLTISKVSSLLQTHYSRSRSNNGRCVSEKTYWQSLRPFAASISCAPPGGPFKASIKCKGSDEIDRRLKE